MPYWVSYRSVIHSNLPWLHNGCTHGVRQIYLRAGIGPTAAVFGESDRTSAVSKNGIIAIGTQRSVDQPLGGIGVVDVQRIPIGVIIWTGRDRPTSALLGINEYPIGRIVIWRISMCGE